MCSIVPRRQVCYGLVEGAPGEAAWRHEREEPKMERAQEPRPWSSQHAQDALLRRTELIISVVLRGGVVVRVDGVGADPHGRRRRVTACGERTGRVAAADGHHGERPADRDGTAEMEAGHDTPLGG